MKNRIADILKNVREKKEICNEQYRHLSPLGSRSEIINGLAKVKKFVTDNVPSVPLSFSAISTPTYKLTKFLVPLLGLLRTNEYTIKDSSTIAGELQSFDSKLVIASFEYKLSTFLYKKELTSVLKINLKTGFFP